MKHIKIYEEYEDLLGDLHGVGIDTLQFDLDSNQMDPFLTGIAKEARQDTKKWESRVAKNRRVVSVKGYLDLISDEGNWVKITMNNGDVLEYSREDQQDGGIKKNLTLNGKSYPQEADFIFQNSPFFLNMPIILDQYDKIIKTGL